MKEQWLVVRCRIKKLTEPFGGRHKTKPQYGAYYEKLTTNKLQYGECYEKLTTQKQETSKAGEM